MPPAESEAMILIASILAAVLMQILVRILDRHQRRTDDLDGAAAREVEQRGLKGLGSGVSRWMRRAKNVGH